MNDKSGQPPARKKPGKYDRWLTDDGLLLLQGWARAGLTDEQIAHNCGITSKTLRQWKAQHGAICTALKDGKEVIDLLVENALLKRAMGYTYEEKTYERAKVDNDGSGDFPMILTKTVVKEVVPDTTAQIFWLKNRKRAEWRDNERMEIERERLELDKRLTEAQITKLQSEAPATDALEVIFSVDKGPYAPNVDEQEAIS